MINFRSRKMQHLRLQRVRSMELSTSPLQRARHLRALRFGRGLFPRPSKELWRRFVMLATSGANIGTNPKTVADGSLRTGFRVR